MQHIIIKNNGPVKDFEMDVNKFNVLIGEQATGKSTIAKSIYYSRHIKTLISNYLIQIMENGSYFGEEINGSTKFYRLISHNLKDIFIQLFGYSWELDPDFRIHYSFSDTIWIESKIANRSKGKRYITVDYSSELKKEINKLQKEALFLFIDSRISQVSLEFSRETRTKNRDNILSKINEIFEDDQTTYYIPAGRSMLTLLSANRATMNSLQNLDFVMNRFLELIDSIRNVYHDGVGKAYQYYPKGDRIFDVHDISRQIIGMQKGEYRNDRLGEVLRVSDENDRYEDVKINFASSGQQEIMWLLNFLYVLMLRDEKAFVIIEEPEAHIYPSLQKKVIDFITQFANICKGKVFITTHSPYVLMTMNNAYYAGCIANKLNEISKVIKQVSRIEKGMLTAYKITSVPQEGAINLINNDEISSDLIDEISDDINEVYTSLYLINEKDSDS